MYYYVIITIMILEVGNLDKTFHYAMLCVILDGEVNTYHDIVHFLEIQ